MGKGRNVIRKLIDKISCFLGMEKDAGYSYFKPGTYLHGYNIRHTTQDGVTGNEIQDVLGNKLSFTLPPVVAQNEIVRFFFTVNSSVETVKYDIFDWNGTPLMAQATLTTTASDATTTIGSFITAVSATLTTGLQTFTFGVPVIQAGNLSGYVDLTITTVTGRGWYSVVTPTAPALAANYYNIIIQEAIDISVVGDQQPIGSFDLLGDLTVYSTSQTKMPVNLCTGNPLVSITNNGAGLIRLTFTNPIAIVNGEAIGVSGITASAGVINGAWIATQASSAAVDLQGSDFTTLTVVSFVNAIVTQYVFGYGTIGVATRDDNTDSWTYTPLLRSKELNFRLDRMIDAHEEQNIFNQQRYFTDNYNPPRVFYYKKPYVTDGGLRINGGFYDFGTIASETQLTVNELGTSFTFLQQVQAGGNVNSGNWRYAYRFVSNSLSATSWSDLSGIVNVYKASINGSPNAIYGDEALVPTGKINQFLISGITRDQFQYVELAGVNYVDNSVEGFLIRRDVLTQSPTQVIEHDGNETAVTPLDLASLLSLQASISRAKNIGSLDNRLILSNITTSNSIDFSSWTKTWTHSVKRKTITSIGSEVNSTLSVNEYQLPFNCFFNMSFMLNDTYRLAAKFRLKNGDVTDAFWWDDIIINNSATNTGNPFGDNRRVAGLPAMDLTDTSGSNVYVFYLEPSNIDMNFVLPDGTPVRDLVSEIIFEMVEMTPQFQEVLAMGIASIGVSLSLAGLNVHGWTCRSNISYDIWVPDFATKIYYTDYVFMEGAYLNNGATTLVPYGTNPRVDPHRDYFSLYSPDIMFGLTGLNFEANDQIINFGNPTGANSTGAFATQTALPMIDSAYNEFFGYVDSVTFPLTTHVVSDLGFIDKGQTKGIGGQNYSKTYEIHGTQTTISNPRSGRGVVELPSSPVCKTTTNISAHGAGTDYGLNIVQYFRAKTGTPNKFGEIGLSNYIPTGSSYIVKPSDAIISTGIQVFGDVFNQKTWLKHRIPGTYTAPDPDGSGNPLEEDCTGNNNPIISTGFGGGIAFYSQNRVNSQMISRGTITSIAWKYPYPANTILLWLNTTETGTINFRYDHGYDWRNTISSDIGFDLNIPRVDTMPTRIYYSEEKPQDSLADNYRNFNPGSFHDCDLSNGEIVGQMTINRELFIFQLRNFEREYFNARGELNTSSSLNVIISDGSVMSRSGETVSIIGATHKWGIVKGKSNGGNDIVCWVNTELKKIMRFEQLSDGTRSISDIEGMQSFFANNLTWVNGKDNPTSGSGICSVFDDRNLQFLWTMRGHKIVADYNPSTTYNLYSEVFDPNGTSTYERTGDIYISLKNNNTSPLSDVLSWQLVPHVETQPYPTKLANGKYVKDYWNEYTVAYDTGRQRFTTFYTFKPKIYLKWTDTLLSPDPIDSKNIYQHNIGNYCMWYNGNDEDGYCIFVYGKDTNMVKRGKALEFSSEIVPERVDMFTKLHQTFMTSADFEDINGVWAVAVRDNILTSPTLSNDDDTSRLTGQYFLIKITLKQGVFQSITDGIIKFSPAARNYTS